MRLKWAKRKAAERSTVKAMFVRAAFAKMIGKRRCFFVGKIFLVHKSGTFAAEKSSHPVRCDTKFEQPERDVKIYGATH
jgi:hypothetical protein